MSPPMKELVQTIHTLRAPDGCPWDRKQSLVDATRYLMEEAGELLDAALSGDLEHVREELADLLFMLCFCTEILSESQPVTVEDVAREGNAKLVRRHPHVFGDSEARDTGESQQRWNEIKAEEKRARGLDPDRESLLKDLPSSSAPLRQAHVYQDNAAEVGFDWPDNSGVWAKIDEELAELRAAEASGSPEEMESEVGDLLFAVVNLSRRLNIPPDIALRRANQRFKGRFQHIEARYDNSRRRLSEASLEDLEAAWQAAKAQERGEP